MYETKDLMSDLLWRRAFVVCISVALLAFTWIVLTNRSPLVVQSTNERGGQQVLPPPDRVKARHAAADDDDDDGQKELPSRPRVVDRQPAAGNGGSNVAHVSRLQSDGAARRESLRGMLYAIVSGSWKDVNLEPMDQIRSAIYKNVMGKDYFSSSSRNIEGHSAQLTYERQVYYKLASMPNIKRICEIGFNMGHSASLWLHANPKAEVLMFDLWAHDYSPRAEIFLKSAAAAQLGLVDVGNRLKIVKGPSNFSVPTFFTEHPEVKCDLLSVDGGHTYHEAIADISNMFAMASWDFNVLLVDDSNCAPSWCVDGAIFEAQRRGLVRVAGRVAERWKPDRREFTRGVTVLQYITP